MSGKPVKIDNEAKGQQSVNLHLVAAAAAPGVRHALHCTQADHVQSVKNTTMLGPIMRMPTPHDTQQI